MSRVHIRNVSQQTPTLEIRTLNRAKGNMYKPIAPEETIILDDKQLSDQIRVLARDKKRRAALLELTILEDDYEYVALAENSEPAPAPEPDPPRADEDKADDDDEDLDEDKLEEELNTPF